MARALLLVALCSIACSRSTNEGGKATGSGAAAPPTSIEDAPASDPPAAAEDGGPGDAATGPAAPSISKVLQVEIRGRVGCARRADGRVRCWGRQWDGTRAATQAAPVEIPDLDDAVAFDHALAGALYVVSGDGTLRRGTLDLAQPVTLVEVPGVADAVDVRVIGKEALALTRDGHVIVAGKGPAPIAGDIIALAASAGGPVQLLERGGGVRQWAGGTPSRVRGLDDAVELFGTRCARRRGGQIACWGRDGRSATWTGPGNIIDRVSGTGFSCDLTSSGVACAGVNDVGQLGTGAGPDRKDPRSVGLPGKAIALSAGERSTCAVLATGEVACWGANDGGQLGDGTLVDRPTPVVIAGLTTPSPPAPSDGLAAVQQASTAMDWSELPTGCTRPKTLVGPGGETIANVVSAYAHTGREGVRVWLADFQLEPGGYRAHHRPARGDQVAFQIALWRGANPRRSPPIDRGRYRDRGARHAALTTYHGEVSGTYGEADVLVETIGKTWICGHLLDPDDTTTRYPFAARFHARTP